MLFRKRINYVVNLLVIAAVLLSIVIPCALPSSAASVKLQAAGYASPAKGAVIRKSPDYKSRKLAVVKKNTKVTITQEIFKNNKSTKSIHRWYAVTCGKTNGYIRSDQIKNIKYAPVPGKTTDFLFYRYGPEKTMQKKGLFIKGKSVQIVLEAYIKGSKEKWYKLKVGNDYYYSHSNWIKIDTSGNSYSGSNSNSGKSTAQKTNTGTGGTNNGTDTATNTVSDVTCPGTIYQGEPFSLRGKVTSSGTITRAVTRIVRSDGTTAIKVDKKVGNKTFDIITVDSQVKFGTLSTGSYRYKVIVVVDGQHYTVINRPFKVVKGKKAERIANKALELAWPVGTADWKYEYGTGKPTEAYKKALDQVYPDRSRWGTAPRLGASCDVFVGTVIRASGVDTTAPRGLDEQFIHYAKSKKWKKISYKGDRSVLRTGDVILLERSNGTHTFIFIRKNGRAYIAEAGYQQMYGRVATGGIMDYELETRSDRTFTVYRIVE